MGGGAFLEHVLEKFRKRSLRCNIITTSTPLFDVQHSRVFQHRLPPFDSMGGGAWPFLVGEVICLVNVVNERDLSLLASDANIH